MSASLFVVVKDKTTYGNSISTAITSHVIKFENRVEAFAAQQELEDHYESSKMVIKVTLLEGTA